MVTLTMPPPAWPGHFELGDFFLRTLQVVLHALRLLHQLRHRSAHFTTSMFYPNSLLLTEKCARDGRS